MQYLECKSVNSDAELLYKIYFEGIRKDLLPIRKNKKNDWKIFYYKIVIKNNNSIIIIKLIDNCKIS